MGSITDANIMEWQQRAGIEPAKAGAAERLCELSRGAYELIRIIELAGGCNIRTGDVQLLQETAQCRQIRRLRQPIEVLQQWLEFGQQRELDRMRFG